MDAAALKELFAEQGEIQFLFHNKSYLIGCYGTKKLFQKIRIQYCIYPPWESTQDIQRLDTLEELLDIKIDGQKLLDILNEIKVI